MCSAFVCLSCGAGDDGGAGSGGAGGAATGGALVATGGAVSSGGVYTEGASGSGGELGANAGGAVVSGGTGGAFPGGAGGISAGGESGAGGTSAGGAGGSDNDRCDVGVWDGNDPQPLTLSGNTFAHDPTMIEASGVFYRFWTGNNVPSATSTDLTRWSNAPTVYGSSYPSWVSTWLDGIPGETFNFPWAPDVSYFGGQYHLYSTFSAVFGDNISCITHLTTGDIAAGGSEGWPVPGGP